MGTSGLRILKVDAESAAAELGIKPGDLILTANGREVPDELALKFYLSEEWVDLCVLRQNGARKHFRVELPESADFGIQVEEFHTKHCNNACMFCFVDQLPPGVRSGLRVKDDDYRLSFLHGNYITLTNLTERDLDRIIEQHLSPLYVSVHATDPDLRTRILGRKKADALDAKLSRLVRGGIRIHTQVVLMPQINDGKWLDQTVSDLFRLYPGVQSVAVVPLGLSDHGKPRQRLTPVTPEYSREIIRQAARWRDYFRSQTGRTFAYLADEFFIQGGVEIPDADYYDDFAQIEDGVGMVRNFLDEFDRELGRRRKSRRNLRGTLVTGKLFYPDLRRCITRFNRKFGSSLRVREIENRFMGVRVTVAGLLAGQDILTGLRGGSPGDFVIVPGEALSRGEGIFVDDLTPKDLARELGKPVYSSGLTARDFFRLLFDRL